VVVPVELGELSAPEQQLWDAFPYGRAALPQSGARTVRAAVIRSLLLGARPAEPGHQAALRLHGAEVVGVLDLHQAEVDVAIDFVDCTFDSVPSLAFARLRGVSFEGSTLPGLDAFAATVGGTLSFVKCTLTGAVVSYGVQVSGDLDFDWAHLSGDGRAEELFGDRVAAVFGDSMQVGRHVYLQGTTASGNLELSGIRVGGAVYAHRGLRVEGMLRLRGADITGEVNLTDAVLLNPGDTALDAWGMHAAELSLRPERVDGTVDLRHSQVQILRDDPANSPARLRLDGARYTALEPAGVAASRLQWLSQDPEGYRPQPYEQLATHYRQIGHEADARTVLLAKQRRRRRQLSPPAMAWGLLQDLLVGYGYRPGRAALWLLGLTALGSVVFHFHPPTSGRGGVAFNPLIYTLDVLVPIVNFGQETAFGFTGNARWLAYLLAILGWLLFTAVAAALTRTFNRS